MHHPTRSIGLVLMLLLAGCAERNAPDAPSDPDSPADEASPPALVVTVPEQYQDADIQDFDYRGRDGTTIHGSLYLPRSPLPGFQQASRFGVVVNLNPYWGIFNVDTDDLLSYRETDGLSLNQSYVAGLLLSHGFAYVAASVPGTGQSSGCFHFGGLPEQMLMADFIDWIGEQSWSNGNVGMSGANYGGMTQWEVAIQQPEHLRAILPLYSITDLYNYLYLDGAPYSVKGPYYPTYYDVWVAFGVDPDPSAPMVDPPMDHLHERLCPDVAKHFMEAQSTTATGAYSSFWAERNYVDGMGGMKAAVLLAQGLWNWDEKPIALDVWDHLPGEKVFWLQQMERNAPYSDEYGKDFQRRDWNATMLAWWDHYLNGADNGIPDVLGAVQVQDHDGLWRNETQWPPIDAQPLTLWLGDGSLSRDEPPAGETVLVSRPSVVTPSVTVTAFGDRDAPAPFQAAFITKPLNQSLLFSGNPRLVLNLSVDRPGTAHIEAELWRIKADGKWQFLDVGGRGLAQRQGREHNDAIVPLDVMEVPVNFHPTASFLDAGDRLALLLSCGDPKWFHPQGNPTFFIQHASRLILPAMPQDVDRGLNSTAMADANPYYQTDPAQY